MWEQLEAGLAYNSDIETWEEVDARQKNTDVADIKDGKAKQKRASKSASTSEAKSNRITSYFDLQPYEDVVEQLARRKTTFHTALKLTKASEESTVVTAITKARSGIANHILQPIPTISNPVMLAGSYSACIQIPIACPMGVVAP